MGGSHQHLSLSEARRLLGVSPSAGAPEIRRAYHEAARRWHPDLHVGSPELERRAEDRMKDLNLAYQIVMRETARAPNPAPSPPRPPVCPRHAADQVYRCRRCGRPACVRCLTHRGCLTCDLEYQPPPRRSRAGAWLWCPILALVALGWWLDWPVSSLLWALWGYLALVGIPVLARLGILGIPLWIGFPITLTVAGAWHLLTQVFG